MPARPPSNVTPEHRRLEQARTGEFALKTWGPYLSERQWGTVREDYSEDGDAWRYFTHDQARSRAYHWGEDGIAGICDEQQRLCLALALWNGADPILKERMFGLTNSEGNHGEDVKEYWFYLDSTPTHSYLKCQYKYPQRAFPYDDLVATNARRGKLDMEYELLDTGIFDEDRYFDVVVEYAKAEPDDILMQVTAHNRGPEAATLHVLPTLGIFDRSAPLPGGGTLEQADGTAWMALYCQWMLQIAVELSRHDPAYIDMALKFIAQFMWISVAVNPPGGHGELWDDEDGFFYDVMRMPDGQRIQLKVRSLVGLLPICAATVFDPDVLANFPGVLDDVVKFIARFSDVVPGLAHLPGPNPEGHRMTALVDETRLRRILSVMLDESEFLGPHGIRAISRRHLDEPCRFDWAGQTYEVHYLPAESDTGMFGGNSNWRGPVWFPMNLVILRGLIQLHAYYGERLRVECPTGSGRELNLLEVAAEIAGRLTSTFTEDDSGRRPVFGGIDKFQSDPHWHDLLLFHEYFHGDNGAGIGASHQTGWTGTVAVLLLLGAELPVGAAAPA